MYLETRSEKSNFRSTQVGIIISIFSIIISIVAVAISYYGLQEQKRATQIDEDTNRSYIELINPTLSKNEQQITISITVTNTGKIPAIIKKASVRLFRLNNLNQAIFELSELRNCILGVRTRITTKINLKRLFCVFTTAKIIDLGRQSPSEFLFSIEYHDRGRERREYPPDSIRFPYLTWSR